MWSLEVTEVANVPSWLCVCVGVVEETEVVKQLHSGTRIDGICPEILKALCVGGLSWMTCLLNVV